MPKYVLLDKNKFVILCRLLLRMVNISVVTYNTPLVQIARLIDVANHCDIVDNLYVIDNSPADNQSLYLALNSDVHKVHYIFTGSNLGYGRAHNIAIKKTYEHKIDYHLVVNADIEFDPTIINNMATYMDTNTNVGMLSPKVYYPNGDVQYLCKMLPTPLYLFARRFLPHMVNDVINEKYEMRRSGYDHIMSVPYLSGCFMFMRTSALVEIGMFDERFFMYPEDIDLTRRMYSSKYKTLFYPEVSVIHNHERASYKSLKMTFIHIINICRYFNKWGWIWDTERKQINKKLANNINGTSKNPHF